MATKRVNVWNLDIYLPDDVESNEVDSVQVWCASCEIDGSIVRESFVSAASINQLGHKAGGRIGKGIVAIVLEDAVITGSIHGAMETVGGTPKTVQHRLRSLKQAAVDGEAQAVPLEGEGEAPAEAPTSEANEAEAETPTADAEAEAEAEGESSALDVNNNQGAQNGACDMSINNQVTSFSRCFPVDSIAKGFVIGYTVEQDPANNGASLIKMGMRAPQNGYVSVGFPSNPGKMIGATAMILKSCQNCAASADLYEVYMTAEDLNGVNPANLLNSTDIQVSVDKSTGEMLGSFVMSWPGKVPRRRLLQAFVKDKALNDFPVIFAAGPVSSSDVALEHSTHGASSLDLTSTTTQISKAAEAESEVDAPHAEGEAEAEAGSSSLDANNNQGAQNGACDMSINNQVTSFSRCFPVDSIAKGFVIGYTVEQDPANNGASLIKMGMRAPQNGYVSVGFPSNPGKMIGATAMILKSCQNCAASADLYEVYMTAEDLNGVNPANLLNSTDIQVSVDKSTGEMLGSFVMSWPGKVPRRRLLQAFVKDKALNDFPVIFAAGPVSSSDVALEHSTHGASSLDLTSTTTQISVEAGLSGTVKAHMWLMTIGWGFLLPLGVLLARMLKVDESNSLPTKNDSSVSGAITKGDDLEDLKSQNISNKPQKVAIWFQTHRAIQTLGFVLGVVGFALGFVENGGWDSEEEVVETHRNLGIATAVLMVIQMTALLWRPAKDHKVRKPWSLWHVWVGRVIIVLIIANIYYGMTKVEVLDTWTWATYTAVLAVMLLVALFDQFYLKRRSK